MSASSTEPAATQNGAQHPTTERHGAHTDAHPHHPANDHHPTHVANDNHPKFLIGGAGITGLYAAYYLMKYKHVPGSSIRIVEAANRIGGHIETSHLDGMVVNKGAEFIDSDQHKILALTKDKHLNIHLIENRDQGAMRVVLPDGKSMEEAEFLAAYAPIAERIAEMKQELVEDPTGPLAQQLNAMSLDDLLDALAAQTEVRKKPGVFRRLWNVMTFNTNRVNPKIIALAKQAYSSEAGNKAQNVNALSFVNEANPTPDAILASDCRYRVEGGMQTITDELARYLKEHGVQFELNAPVNAVRRDDHGRLHVAIGGANPREEIAENFLPAMPAYCLKNIEGLEALGMSPEVFETIATAQYTNSIKFSVRLKDDVTADQIRFANGTATAANSTFFSANGYQCWSSNPRMLTFLVNADDVSSGKIAMKPFIESCMADYAVVNGRNPADIFYPVDGNSVVLSNPGKAPCYASAAKNQFLSLIGLGHSMDTMAGSGVAPIGTFIPYRTADGSYSTGFIEGGLHSAEHACEMLLEHHRAKEHGHTPQKWVDRTHTKPSHANDHAHAASPAHAAHAETHGHHTAALADAAANGNQPLTQAM